MIWLFMYVLAISLNDLRTRRIPNWYTIPLIITGLIAHFPGQITVWFASFILVSAWENHWMGAGDAKLWIALLWALPVEHSPQVLLFMSISFLFTSLFQILWRMAKNKPSTSQLTPAAWRTIPFILLCWYVH